MKKSLLTGVLIIIAILAILPFWAGYKAQSQIEQQLASFNQRITPFGVQIEISDYQRGYLSSDLSINAQFNHESKSSIIHIEHAPLTLTGLDIARASSNNPEAPTNARYSITGQLNIEQSISAYNQFPGGKLAWQGAAAHFPDTGHLQLDIPTIHTTDDGLDVHIAPINLSADFEPQQITVQLPEFSLNISSYEDETLLYHYQGIKATVPLHTIGEEKYPLSINMQADSIDYNYAPTMQLHIAPYQAEAGFYPDGDHHYAFRYATNLENINLSLDTSSDVDAYATLVPNAFHTDISIFGISTDSVASIVSFVTHPFSPEVLNMDSIERDNYLADYFEKELQPVLKQNLFDEDMRLTLDINASGTDYQATANAEGIEHIHNDEELDASQNSVQSDNLLFDGSHANISISARLFDNPIIQDLGITPSELQLSEYGQTYQLNAEIRDGTTYINGEPTNF
ncbi:YdgA family protein [Cardiobacteriaceae bacterium TAE3-ERU3]|nr:YdgA family protein [Cardiobacteriaceae bacterium TAE3-ERU3]